MSSSNEIERLTAALRQAMQNDRLAHAYLLTGRSRPALQAAAGEILALLYCEHSLPQRPCGNCHGCRRAAAHNHPDLLWIEPQSVSRRIVVEQIQQMREHMLSTALSGGWKSVVLVDADRLNPETSNILLKTLEEPPPRSFFLLLTDSPDELIATIISRCQRLQLNSRDPEESRAARDLVIEIMAADIGNGMVPAVIRARRLLERLQTIKKELHAEADMDDDNPNLKHDKILRDKLDAISKARAEARYNDQRETVMEWLMLWHRDLLICRCGGEDSLLAFAGNADTLRAAAAGLTQTAIMDKIGAVEEMHTQLARNLPETAVIENGFVRLESAH